MDLDRAGKQSPARSRFSGRWLHRSAVVLLPALGLAPLGAIGQDAVSLAFPVDCTLGDTCFIQQMTDHDPGPGARDFRCGPQSYDGHTGTDIRVADLQAMAEGMAVTAAAPGIVRAVREGEADGVVNEGVECGNGVAIIHTGGWETLYCHLARGSVAVAEGDEVATGTVLGRIGLSGNTEFPHLHFELRLDGRPVDPFAPSDGVTCDSPPPAIWSVPIDVAEGGIMAAGFAPGIPELADIEAGTADSAHLSPLAPALVVWGFVHGGREGDLIRLRVADGTGAEILAADQMLDRTQAQLFRAAGRRRPPDGWPPGPYVGEVTMIRDGEVLSTRRTSVTIR